MNNKLKQLAVEVGGSHYPSVSKNYLPRTAELIYQEAVTVLAQAGYEDASVLLDRYYKENYENLG